MDISSVQQYVKGLLLAVFLCTCADGYASVSFAAADTIETSRRLAPLSSSTTSISQLLQEQEDNFRVSQRRSNRFAATIVAVLIAFLLVALAFILCLVLKVRTRHDPSAILTDALQHVPTTLLTPEVQTMRRRCAATELPSEDEWQHFEAMIDSQCNGFARHLSSVYKLSTQEFRVCLLIKAQFKPSEIALLTAHSKEAITSTRRRLYKKLTGTDGTPEMLDDLIYQA